MKVDFCIVGGGIVGLATARALLERRPGASLLVLEKEAALATHQTSHNSGVIHAGVYYTPGSLKARLCREGNRLTREFCRAHAVPFEVPGKLIVATDSPEVARLGALGERCRANGIDHRALDGAGLRALEPRIRGAAALLVPSSGIVSYTALSAALGREVQSRGGEVRLGAAVTAIDESTDEVRLALAGSGAVRCDRMIACAGLQSDRIAQLAGLDPPVRIVPFRGEYFRLPAALSGVVRHLIYPVPDPALPFLGVHLTRMIDGSVTVGPNAVLSFAREGYDRARFDLRDTAATLGYGGFWRLLPRLGRSALAELRSSLSRGYYLAQCRKYCPELRLEDLMPYPTGIRAQAVDRGGALVHDFLFADTARTVHVLNAPSPAATAALPIGRMVAARTLGEPDPYAPAA
ncbi:MAG: L-2-hydroxyglutarate oxidase [Proteobacteria bacterium]|nr:L-2-hydroxyglutarate oxidase [Pseudomonadota bacterium]